MASGCCWALGSGLEVFSFLFLVTYRPVLFLAFGLVLNPSVLGPADFWYQGGCFTETCWGVPHVALWWVLQKLVGSSVSEGLQTAAQSFQGEV